MKLLSSVAGHSSSYTSHCLRATAVILLDGEGFEARHIMAISGHKSETSIKNYARTDEGHKRKMSAAIGSAVTTEEIQVPSTAMKRPRVYAKAYRENLQSGPGAANAVGSSLEYKYAAFSMYLDSSLTASSYNQKVVFDKVETNYGNAYDTKTGVFTCPTSGIYVFHWTSLKKHGYKGPTMLFINGKYKRTGSYAKSISYGAHDYKSSSSDAVFELNKGDTVWIVTSKEHFLNCNYTAFQEWLQKAL